MTQITHTGCFLGMWLLSFAFSLMLKQNYMLGKGRLNQVTAAVP